MLLTPYQKLVIRALEAILTALAGSRYPELCDELYRASR